MPRLHHAISWSRRFAVGTAAAQDSGAAKRSDPPQPRPRPTVLPPQSPPNLLNGKQSCSGRRNKTRRQPAAQIGSRSRPPPGALRFAPPANRRPACPRHYNYDYRCPRAAPLYVCRGRTVVVEEKSRCTLDFGRHQKPTCCASSARRCCRAFHAARLSGTSHSYNLTPL